MVCPALWTGLHFSTPLRIADGPGCTALTASARLDEGCSAITIAMTDIC